MNYYDEYVLELTEIAIKKAIGKSEGRLLNRIENVRKQVAEINTGSRFDSAIDRWKTDKILAEVKEIKELLKNKSVESKDEETEVLRLEWIGPGTVLGVESGSRSKFAYQYHGWVYYRLDGGRWVAYGQRDRRNGLWGDVDMVTAPYGLMSFIREISSERMRDIYRRIAEGI